MPMNIPAHKSATAAQVIYPEWEELRREWEEQFPEVRPYVFSQANEDAEDDFFDARAAFEEEYEEE